EGARDHDRARLRAARSRGPAGRGRRRARPRAGRQVDGRRRDRARTGRGRDRGRRRRGAADPRGTRQPRPAWPAAPHRRAGFARLDLGDRRVAVVDVPGHERFVKSMVAGATGLDLVVLVIAADEGVMPQTREHLDICDLLGVRRGIVALTKRDLVDDEWLAMVTADVRAALAGTFL